MNTAAAPRSLTSAAVWGVLIAAAIVAALVGVFGCQPLKPSATLKPLPATPSIGHAAAATARVDASLTSIADVARQGRQVADKPVAVRATLTTIDGLAGRGLVDAADVAKLLDSAEREVAELRTAQVEQVQRIEADDAAKLKTITDRLNQSQLERLEAVNSFGYRAEQFVRDAVRWIEWIVGGGIGLAIVLWIASAIFAATPAGPWLKLASNGALHVGTFLVSLVVKNIFHIGHQAGVASVLGQPAQPAVVVGGPAAAAA